jgi:hypothetical protein
MIWIYNLLILKAVAGAGLWLLSLSAELSRDRTSRTISKSRATLDKAALNDADANDSKDVLV